MTLLILFVFIVLPIAEIAVLIKVADVIDLMPTIMLIILTAVIGVGLLRQQGLSSLSRAQNSLNEGRLPVDGIIDAIGLMLAGAFLLTPGLITDSLGFALLVPAIRHGLAHTLFKRAAGAGSIKVDIFGTSSQESMNPDPFSPDGEPRSGDHDNHILEGEIIEPPKKPSRNKRPGGPFSRGGRDKKSPWGR